jgi:phosphoserine phosphatase
MNKLKQNGVLKKYQDRSGVQKAMTKAVQEALKQHKEAGNKVPIWSGNQVVYVEPDWA